MFGRGAVILRSIQQPLAGGLRVHQGLLGAK